MIILQAATTILVAVIALAFVVDWVAERRQRQEFDRDLTELEAQQHLYPNGNVHLLESRPVGEATPFDREKD